MKIGILSVTNIGSSFPGIVAKRKQSEAQQKIQSSFSPLALRAKLFPVEENAENLAAILVTLVHYIFVVQPRSRQPPFSECEHFSCGANEQSHGRRANISVIEQMNNLTVDVQTFQL